MIERFNFYDVYGYLIPGLVMTGVIIVPYGIVTRHWPSTELASVAIVLVAAYIVGHFVQAMASGAIPSKLVTDKSGNPTYPSVLMLNPSNPRIQATLRKRIAALVKARFDIDLDITTEIVDTTSDAVVARDGKSDKSIASERNNVFYLCRPVVNKTSSYAEQFQGLYVLMRGLFVSCLLGAAFYIGWLIAYLRNVDLDKVASLMFVAALVLNLVVSVWRAFDRQRAHHDLDTAGLVVLAFALLTAGILVAARPDIGPSLNARNGYTIASIGAGLTIAAFRFYALYRYFADEFANAVWTYFGATDIDTKSGSGKDSQGAHSDS